MATGTAIQPSSLTKWVASVYAKRVDRLAYEISKYLKRCYEEEPLRGILHVPKFDNLTVTSHVDSDVIYEPAFTAPTDGEFTVSPTYYECNVAIDDRMIGRMVFDVNGTLRTGVEMALAQKSDVVIATQFGSFVTNVVGDYVSGLTLANILSAKAKVLAGGKEYASPGNINFGYHTSQDDEVMGISALTQWIARGDAGNAAKTGILGQAYGIDFIPSTVVQASGGGYANGMWIERAISYSFNIRPSTKLQDHGNAKWILGQMDQGAAIARDQYGCLVKSN